MSELQLEGPAAQRESHELVAEADAKDRDAAEQVPDRVDRILKRLGIAGAVGEEHPVGFHRQRVLCARGRRDHGHVAAGAPEVAEDVVLDPVIVGDHLE